MDKLVPKEGVRIKDKEIIRVILNGNKIVDAVTQSNGKISAGVLDTGIPCSIAAQGIVASAHFFALNFNLSLILIGVLITGLGSTLPEIYFAIASARKGETWMILGDLMGAVIIPATLVLGIVALICPISNIDFSPFAIARIFLIISAVFFFFFVRTDRVITKKEAFFLLGIYIAFVLVEILTR